MRLLSCAALSFFALPLNLGCDDDGGLEEDRQEAHQSCSFMGQEYESGTIFPAGDGCNSCSCNPNGDRPGEVECSLIACTDCSMCTEEELCVIDVDENCVDAGVRCVTTGCDENCSSDCDAELCDSGASCQLSRCPASPTDAYECGGL